MTLRLRQSPIAILNAIKHARLEKGWTLADLEAATGIEKSILNRYENEEYYPPLDRAILIAAAFGKRVEDFWNLVDEELEQEQKAREMEQRSETDPKVPRVRVPKLRL